MHNSKPLPPLEFLQEKLNYCPETGVLTWKVGNGHAVKAGDRAGNKTPRYRSITFHPQGSFLEHRIAWKLYYGTDPAGRVDHRNGNGFDNRISNLREATHSQNMMNQSRPDKGVRFDKSSQRWMARVQVNKVSHYLGCHKTKEEALEAVRAKREELHGEFARHA